MLTAEEQNVNLDKNCLPRLAQKPLSKNLSGSSRHRLAVESFSAMMQHEDYAREDHSSQVFVHLVLVLQQRKELQGEVLYVIYMANRARTGMSHSCGTSSPFYSCVNRREDFLPTPPQLDPNLP